MSDHFEGLSASKHVISKFTHGVIFSSESHELQINRGLTTFADNLKSASFELSLFGLLTMSYPNFWVIWTVFAISNALWKSIRTAMLSWSKLESMNRHLSQEYEELLVNRDQEKLELKSLYALKGFQEPLLTEVVEVLMSDTNRALEVMVQQELGLSLQKYEHPLKTSMFAFLGSAFAAIILSLATTNLGFLLLLGTLLVLIGSYIIAKDAGNNILQATIWSASGFLSILWGVYVVLHQLQF